MDPLRKAIAFARGLVGIFEPSKLCHDYGKGLPLTFLGEVLPFQVIYLRDRKEKKEESGGGGWPAVIAA